MSLLVAEFQGVLDGSWDSKRPLIFSHVTLTNKLGVFRVREIRLHLSPQMDL